MESFAVAADAQIEVCNVKKQALVSVIDTHNALVDQLTKAMQPRPFWRFWAR